MPGFTMDMVSEGRLKEINPVLAAKVRSIALQLISEKIEIRVVQGLRSWAMQQELWQQGRDAMGHIVEPSKVVTHAPPGDSWHEFGLAVDVCPFVNEKPDWELTNPGWLRIQQEGIKQGLYPGACFHNPDHPHLQLTGTFPVNPNDEVRQTFREVGMEGVWQEAGVSA